MSGPEVESWNETVRREEIIPKGMKNYEIWIPEGAFTQEGHLEWWCTEKEYRERMKEEQQREQGI